MELLKIFVIYALCLAIGVIARGIIYKWEYREIIKSYLIFLSIGLMVIPFFYICG